MIGRGTFHAVSQSIFASPDVSGAQNQSYLNAQLLDLADLAGDLGGPIGIDAIALRSGQGLAADLEQDAFVFEFSHQDQELELLADLNARKAAHDDVFAQLGDGLSDQVTDRLTRVLDERLV